MAKNPSALHEIPGVSQPKTMNSLSAAKIKQFRATKNSVDEFV
ncbi:MAG: methylmalonyl Co-A mutase-associated GTPase MeaB, partial [Flavobacteriaceae bacterium CG_4_8_14_3_um_filter_31_8]